MDSTISIILFYLYICEIYKIGITKKKKKTVFQPRHLICLQYEAVS